MWDIKGNSKHIYKYRENIIVEDPFNLLNSYSQNRRRKDFPRPIEAPIVRVLHSEKKKKKTSRPEIVVAVRRDFVLVSFLKYCVFSAVIFPDFSMGARIRVDAFEGCATMNASPSVQELGGCSLRRSVVNRRNLYDLRKQIIGATLTSRSITLGRTPTSAF